MQFGKLYTQSTKLPPEEKAVRPKEVDATRAQAKLNWMQSTITQEMVEAIKNEITDLMDKSVALSITYPSHNNHQQIIQNLVRIDTLRKQVEKYVSAQ